MLKVIPLFGGAGLGLSGIMTEDCRLTVSGICTIEQTGP
jgi:hypothetical protein